MLRGAIGWFREVFPVSRDGVSSCRLPRYRLRCALDAQSGPPATGISKVIASIFRSRFIPYSAGLLGGVIGGVGMAIIACLYGLIAQGSLWYPINLLAAAALPSLASAGLGGVESFSLCQALIVALISHGVISSLVGLLYAAILPMMPSRFTAFWEAFCSCVVDSRWSPRPWKLCNPALNARIAWGWFIASQVAFGLITGYIVAHSKTIETAQSWPSGRTCRP